MQDEIGRLVDDYDQGRISRRDVTALLTGMVLAAARSATAQAEESATFQAVGLNHIALSVADVVRSRDFYQEHLGLTVARESASSCFLDCGSQFVALFKGSEAGMDHYCYSVEGYAVGKARDKLAGLGIKPRVAGNRIYFPDPDGLTVQLAAPDHSAR